MRAYEVKCEIDDGEGDTQTAKQFAGTQAQVREIRQTFVNDYGVKKKDVEVEEVDIPTGKQDLLDFINGLLE